MIVLGRPVAVAFVCGACDTMRVLWIPLSTVKQYVKKLGRRMTETANTRVSGDRRLEPLVLIVDDDREQAEQIAAFLSRFGISVMQEDNGFAAVNTLRRHKPAVVVMDVRMAGLEGIKAAQLASNLAYKPKIILMSGYYDQVKRATEERAEERRVGTEG